MNGSTPPSKIRDQYWVQVSRAIPGPDWTERSGKWLLFVPMKKLDQVWELISEETSAGRLGIASKAATAKRNPLARNPWIKVICVYTYDFDDVADVMRVRQRLREIGFTKEIAYKSDRATQQGIYSTRSERVSMFFE